MLWLWLYEQRYVGACSRVDSGPEEGLNILCPRPRAQVCYQFRQVQEELEGGGFKIEYLLSYGHLDRVSIW